MITARTLLATEFGNFAVHYHRAFPGGECVSFTMGHIREDVPIVRFQSACLFGMVFQSRECDCGTQFKAALQAVLTHGNGVLVYSPDHEGRGAGLENKIRGMEVERTQHCDSYVAYERLGLKIDYRDYRAEILALEDLRCSKSVLFEGNDEKRLALERAGFEIAGGYDGVRT